MKTNEIGITLKRLRKARNITQEKLAEHLNISFQSVSKWENGITMPDIIMLPSIASYFGVSIDELFSFNLKEEEEKIQKICNDAYQFRQNKPQKAEEILKQGLKQFPNNEILLNNLLYVVAEEEQIQIAERLVSETAFDDVKYDSLRFLTHAYKKRGEDEYAKATVNKIPELYFTKLGVAAYVLEGEEKRDAAEKEKWIAFQELLEMMFKLYEYYTETGNVEKAQKEITDAISLMELMNNSNFNEDFLPFFKKHLKDSTTTG